MMGWTCPGCGSGYSPYQTACWRCVPRTVPSTTTTPYPVLPHSPSTSEPLPPLPRNDADGRYEVEATPNGKDTMISIWAQLTPTKRDYLRISCDRGLKPTDTLDQKAIAELEVEGLIHRTTSKKGRARLQATDTGRGLVASRGLLPTYLRAAYKQSHYTHSYHQAMRDEPESMGHAA
jgi:hypothetical protein